MSSQENIFVEPLIEPLVEPLIEPLTRREREILALLAQGYSAPEIAEQLVLAVSSVKWHIQHLYGKLGVNSKRQALTRAKELGLLEKFSPTAAPQSHLSPTGRTFGPYHLLEKLGAGGMADVYKAYQPRLERYIALKFIRPELLAEPGFIARFEHEARLLARFNHPNIVHIYDFGEDTAAGTLTQCYLVMELVAGQTLAEWLKAQGRPLTLAEALLILRQVSAALDAAHAQHIVHLDVKPSNIMLTPDGRALLSDFGLSRLVQTEPKDTDSLVTSGTPHYMSPEQISGDVARIGIASDVYAVGIVTYEMLTGRVPFLGEPDHPVLLQHLQDPVPSPRTLNPNLPEAAEAVLLKALAKDPTERYPQVGDFMAALAEGVSAPAAVAAPAAWPTLTLDESPAPGEPPFKGLHYFDEADADLFFGREALTARLIQRLHGGRFLAVVGASGSGKSSVVRAGVLPALRRSDSPPALLHVITPTAHPLEVLAVTLTRNSERVTDTANLLDDLAYEPRTLYLWTQRLLAEGQTLLLVIDQFEEAFTLCHDEVERRAFIDNLMTAIGSPSPDHALRSGEGVGGGVSILLTLRADFYAYCGQYPELRDWLAARQEYIGPMTSDELRAAIEQPAAHGEWAFEPGLVDLLLQDVEDEPGALPLLSHALLETWQRRRGRTLTFGGYTASGGVRGAIAKTADAVYSQLDPEGQAIARSIFLRLTELGEGTQDTRRRVSFNELIPNNQTAAPIESVLKTLADARLITTSEGAVDVAHEALIREWPTLREWLNENRESLRLHRHLTEAAQAWAKLNRDPGELYRGARLTQALEWAEWSTSRAELNTLELDFLLASKELAEREEAEREAQRQRELEAAQKLVATEKQAAARMRTRNRVITGVGALAFLAAIIAVFFSLQSSQNANRAETNLSAAQVANTQSAQHLNTANDNAATAQAASTQAVANRDEAQRQAQLARIRELLANSKAVSEQDPVNSLLLVVEAWKVTVDQPVPAVEQALRDALADPGGLPLVGHERPITTLAFSPDGRWLATGSGDHTARLWEVDNPTATPKILSGHEGAITALAFSPDSRWLATGSDDHTTRLWDMGAVSAGPVAAWRVLGEHEGGITALAFSLDGKWLVTGSRDATARLWDMGALSAGPAAEPIVLREHTEDIIVLAFSPDGNWLATGSEDNTARLWDMSNLAADSIVLPGHKDTITALAFSPDGRWLATGSIDQTARLWDLGDPTAEPMVLRGHKSFLTVLAFSPDGKWLASGAEDSSARLWDMGAVSAGLAAAPIVLRQHAGIPVVAYDIGYFLSYINALAFSRDGKWLAMGGADNTTHLWDTSDLTAEPVILRGHTEDINVLAFSPDGRWLATGSEDNTTRLWDLSGSAADSIVLRGHEGLVTALAVSPDGRWLATGSIDNTARLWELSDPGAKPIVLPGADLATISEGGDLRSSFNVLAFSPDGRWLAAGGADNTVRRWDMSDLTAKPIALPGHEAAITALAFSPDGRWLASGVGDPSAHDTTVRLWDMSNPAAEPIPLSGHEAWIFALAFSPDGRWLATGSMDLTARLWDMSDPTKSIILRGHGLWVVRLAFSPDGRWLATSSGDKTTRLWDMRDPAAAEFTVLHGHEAVLSAVAFSPDGKWLATGSWENTARLWDMSNPTAESIALHGHQDWIDTLAFSPDGKWLATGSRDGTTRLWDMSNPIAESIALSNSGSPTAFSPDGKWLATGSADFTARLWLVSPDALAQRVCQFAGRNFSLVQWAQYFPDEPYHKTCEQWPEGSD